MNIEAGDDVVIISSGFGGFAYELRKVDRVTKTQVIVGNMKFRLSDGYRVGQSGWLKDRIDIVNDR